MRQPTLLELADYLVRRETTSRALVEDSLARIADPDGEGVRAFLTVYAERSRAEADAVDASRAKGEALPRFAGVPLAIKDLFDVAGEPTRAGSRIWPNRGQRLPTPRRWRFCVAPASSSSAKPT